MKWVLLSAMALMLSGCSSGSGLMAAGVAPPAPPVPTPSPSPVALRTRRFRGDWTGPSIGLTGYITQDGALDGGDPNATWLTFNRPGCQGADCIDPGPNKYYRAESGTLYLHADNPGWPLLSRETFDGGLTVECTVACSLPTHPEAFAGPVIYCSEASYRALYFLPSDTAGYADIHVYGPTQASGLLTSVPAGTVCALSMSYDGAGGWKYGISSRFGGGEFIDTLADPRVLIGPPRVGFFTGIMDLIVGETNVWSGS